MKLLAVKAVQVETRIRQVVQDASSPQLAARRVTDVFADWAQGQKFRIRPRFSGDPSELSAGEAETNVQVAERRLVQVVRALRQSPHHDGVAPRILGFMVLRHAAAVNGARALNAFVSGGPLRNSSPTRSSASLLAHDLSRELSRGPDGLDVARVVELARALRACAPRRYQPQTPAVDVHALHDALQSRDPLAASVVLDRLSDGSPLDTIADAAVSRRRELGQVALASADTHDKLHFDLSLNRFVEKDTSWSYAVSLAQLLEYTIPNVFDGRRDIASRLAKLTTDPLSRKKAIPLDAIRSFVDDLYTLRDTSTCNELCGRELDVSVVTTDGGQRATAVDWQLDAPLLVDLVATLTDYDRRAAIHHAAQTKRAADAAELARRRKPAEDLLRRYRGIPERHRRVHNALINCGRARLADPTLRPQTMAALGADDGALPRRQTLLTPQNIGTRYPTADKTKVRFVITDELECFAIDDDTFHDVVNRFGIPPNHELIGYNRPLLASGYLIIDHGRIIGSDDDTTLMPGKLPDNLPPGPELLRALGFVVP